jgi:NAD+-dependent secondary alcohol dehydrogenase Adh1
MIAARLHEYHEALRVESIAEPRIEGPHDVIVRIGGAGLCRTDLHVQEGQWAANSGVELPYVLGHENAGWVHEIGSAVTNVAVGDTVILHPLVTCGLCRACRAGDDVHCENNVFPGISVDGGFAELIKTNARAVVKLDPVLHPKDIAALADAGLTAYHAVKKAARLLYPGTRAVVIGAGGLGHIGIQVLRALTPAEIIVIDPSEDALALAGELGADRTVQVQKPARGADHGVHRDTIMELTDGHGAEAVIDFVGERGAIQDGISVLRNAGSYFVIGYGENIDVPTIDVISREINFVGNLVGSYNDLAELMTLTAQGRVTLHTTAYPLDAVGDAMADLDNGRLRGRGILIPAGADA